MSINSVPGTGRVALQNADPPVANAPIATATATAPPATPSRGAPEAAASDSVNKPPPLRFPWLSRLSAQLEPVARQKSPFTAAPMLGDNLDRAA